MEREAMVVIATDRRDNPSQKQAFDNDPEPLHARMIM